MPPTALSSVVVVVEGRVVVVVVGLWGNVVVGGSINVVVVTDAEDDGDSFAASPWVAAPALAGSQRQPQHSLSRAAPCLRSRPRLDVPWRPRSRPSAAPSS
jgi:hypothetical protein